MTTQTQTRKNNPAVEQKPTPLRFVMPKNGHLKKEAQKLFSEAGFSSQKNKDRQDYGVATDALDKTAPFEILFQRSTDAADNLEIGCADMAIIGYDFYNEAALCGEKDLGTIAATFNFAACSLWIAAPQSAQISAPEDLCGKTLVTSYPNSLRAWLEENSVADVKIIERKGGVEDYVRLGVADAICDIVETGTSLDQNDLERKIKVLDSSAVLVISNKNAALKQQAAAIAKKLIAAERPPRITAETPRALVAA